MNRPVPNHLTEPAILGIVLLVLIIISCAGVSQAEEPDIQYRTPMQIDDTQIIAPSSDCREPTLLRDTNGVQHAFWISEFTQGTLVTHGVVDPVNGSLSDIVYVSKVVRSFQENIAVALQDDESIAVVWRDDINFREAIYGAMFDIEMGTFSKPVEIYICPSSNTVSPRPDITCNSEGIIWVGWVETLDGRGIKLSARCFNGTFTSVLDTIVIGQSEDIYYSISYGPELISVLDGDVLIACSYWNIQTNKVGINIYRIDAFHEIVLGGNIETERSISGRTFLQRLDAGTNHLYYSTMIPGRSDPSVFLAVVDSSGKVIKNDRVLDTDGEKVLDAYSSVDGGKGILFQSSGAGRAYWISVAGRQSTEFGKMVRIHGLWGSHDYMSGALTIADGVAHIVTTVYLAHQPFYTLFLHLASIDINDTTLVSSSFLVPGFVGDPSRSDGTCAVDDEGTVHALFVDDRTYYPTVYHTRLVEGRGPGESQPLETLEYCLNARPRLLAHPDGGLTAFWWRTIPGKHINWNYSIVARTSSDRGSTWSSPVTFERGDQRWSWTDYTVTLAANGSIYLVITGFISPTPIPGSDGSGFIKVYLIDREGMVLSETVFDSDSTGLDSKLITQPLTYLNDGSLSIIFSNSPQSISVATPASISMMSLDVETGDFGPVKHLWSLPTDEFFGTDISIDDAGTVWFVWTQRNDTAVPSTNLWVAEFDPQDESLLHPRVILTEDDGTSIRGFYFPKVLGSSEGLVISTFFCNWSFSEMTRQWVGSGGVALFVDRNGTAGSDGWYHVKLHDSITFPPIDSWTTTLYYPEDMGILPFPISSSSVMTDRGTPLIMASFPDRPNSKHGDVLAFLPNGIPTIPEIISPIDGATITDPVVILSVTESVDPDGDEITYRFLVEWNDGQDLWTGPWTNSTVLAFRWTIEGLYSWTVEVSDQYLILQVPWVGVFQSFGSAPFADAGGPYIGWEGEPVLLNASASWDDTGILSYEWDLDGDEVFDIETTEPIVSHTWMDDFSNIITLKVTDVTGTFSFASSTVTIMNRPPVPQVDIEGDLFEGQEITFSCTVEDISPQDTFMIFWVIDGRYNKSGPRIGHVFEDNGDYLISMNVIDDDNGIGHWETVVTISNVAPVIGPIADLETWEDVVVIITPTVSDAPLDDVVFEWTIDGVQLGSGMDFNHTFTDPGEYLVGLDVIDKDGDSDSVEIMVTVKDRILPVTLGEPRDITKHSVRLDWTASDEYGFVSYSVRISTTQGFDDPVTVLIDDPASISSQVGSLKPGTYYYAEVELRCINGTSTSNTVTFYTKYEEVSVWTPWPGLWVLIVIVLLAVVLLIYIRRERDDRL